MFAEKLKVYEVSAKGPGTGGALISTNILVWYWYRYGIPYWHQVSNFNLKKKYLVYVKRQGTVTSTNCIFQGAVFNICQYFKTF